MFPRAARIFVGVAVAFGVAYFLIPRYRSLFALMASDTVYGLSVLNSNWQIGGPVDAVWILYYVAVGLAALHPSMVSLSESARVNPA
jgi:hypothetical protein